MSVAGRLLVATPPMNDPNFERAVVLMLTHDETGAFGLVLTRATDLAALDDEGTLSNWISATSSPNVLFDGGPVQRDSVIGIARLRDDDERSWATQVGAHDLCSVDLNTDSTNATECSHLRLFVGYSGWGPAQLDGEIVGGHWFVLDAASHDAFDGEPHTLWRRVLERSPEHREWVQRFPDDPGAN